MILLVGYLRFYFYPSKDRRTNCIQFRTLFRTDIYMMTRRTENTGLYWRCQQLPNMFGRDSTRDIKFMQLPLADG